jgi:Icc-related predicted phosphoesterase
MLRQLGPMLQAWKRARPALRIFAIPGNDDCRTILPALEELGRDGLIENLHQRSGRLGDYTFVGLAFVPPTPFAIKDFERRDHAGAGRREARIRTSVVGTPQGFEVLRDFEAYLNSNPTIEEELNRLPVTEPQRTIAVIHCPPLRTRCDVLHNGQHIGSEALRRWIERVQPLLTLHGHIHESPQVSGAFCDRIGTTVVINPGADGQRPHLVQVNLEDLSALGHSVYGKSEIAREC